jgi:hypothetical protein
MTTSEIKEVLLWCVGINYGVLLLWFGAFVYAHDWMYRMHTRWFKLSVETFDAINYAGVATYRGKGGATLFLTFFNLGSTYKLLFQG